MNRIFIIGLGPGDYNYLTPKAISILTSGSLIHLRTQNHPCVKELCNQGMQFKSFDEFYDKATDFDSLYFNIAQTIIDLQEHSDVYYALPGNPHVAERTTKIILESSKLKGIKTVVIPGVSFIDAMINTLKIDPIDGLNIVDALDEDAKINPQCQNIFVQLHSQLVASLLKIRLMEHYDDNTPVTIVKSAGVKESQELIKIPLYQLDRSENSFDHLTSLYIEKMPPGNDTIDELIAIIRHLRSGEGDPWYENLTTYKSIIDDIIEEIEELKEAIEEDDICGIEEELGDSLMALLFNAVLAEDLGDFTLRDSIRGIIEKLIRRHPHVFGDEKADTLEQAMYLYERAKALDKLNSRRKKRKK